MESLVVQTALTFLTVHQQDHGVAIQIIFLTVQMMLFVFLLLALLPVAVDALVLVLVLTVVYRYLVHLEIFLVAQILLIALTAHLMDHGVVLLPVLIVRIQLFVFLLLALLPVAADALALVVLPTLA